MADAAAPGRRRTLLAITLFVTYGYFLAPAAWNENSRFDLVRSLVERGRVDIDPYHDNTGDKAFRDGHYYSDKAPGTALLAVPAYAAYRTYLRLTGKALPATRPSPDGDADRVLTNAAYRRALYVSSLSTSALAGALLGGGFWLFMVGLGVAGRDGIMATLTLSLGSLVFPYSTLFYGHVLAAAFLFGAFAIVHRAATRPSNRVTLQAVSAGALAGAAVITEFPAAGGGVLIAAYACARLGWRRTAVFAAGATPSLVALLAYQAAAFGHPLSFGYSWLADAEFARGMSTGIFGVGPPRADVLYEILLGSSRGLLYVSPVLVLGFLGLARMIRSSGHRPEAVLAAAMVVYFLALGSGYYLWSGGAALGPRHVIPMLPFLCLGVAFALPGRIALPTGLLTLSMANQLVATAVGPEAPPGVDPLVQYAYRHFLAGRVAVLPGTGNLGQMLGLNGPLSLLPLLLVWALTASLLRAPAPGGRSGSAA